MERVSAAPSSVLLLDYDGTLAPFHNDRYRAYPYPRVIPLLESILEQRRSRVIIVTGRPIRDMAALLHPLNGIEIWGSHGLEHQLPDGTLRQMAIAPEADALLAQARQWLTSEGFAGRTEIKPGGLAVHWRGLTNSEVAEIAATAWCGLNKFAQPPSLKLLQFDGGVELRLTRPHKGDAVASILGSTDAGTPIAYLGDDFTDEDAFAVLNPHGLTALVRSEARPTSAQIWLRPPEELLRFLDQWRSRVSRT